MRTSRFNVALNDSAGAPAALEPTAPMDWVTSSLLHSAAKSLEVWTDPWPAWSTAPFRLPRVAAACWRASMTKGGRAHVVAQRPGDQAPAVRSR